MHGFQTPVDLVQLLAYVGYVFNLAIFYALTIFVFSGSNSFRIIVGVLYGILVLWVLLVKLIATRINPSDPLFKKTEKLLLQNIELLHRGERVVGHGTGLPVPPAPHAARRSPGSAS